MKNIAFTLYVTLKAMFFPVAKDVKLHDFKKSDAKISTIAHLPVEIDESSGLEILSDTSYLTHNDGGAKPFLFRLNKNFEIDSVYDLKPLKNLDWETLASDSTGKIYIGDTGNNFNRRKNLRIVILNNRFKQDGLIEFSYPDQKAFPPEKENMNFDCEAMFYYKDSLYLFSKNRGDKHVKLYKLPSRPGEYIAELVDSIELKGYITGADINLELHEFTLVSYGYLYRFSFGTKINFSKPRSVKYYGRLGQAESVCYQEKSIVITNEAGKVFCVY